MKPPLGAAALLFLGLLAGPAAGAARARDGGTLAVGLVGLGPPVADTSADSPEAASARALLALPLCRLRPGPVPLLASLTRTSAGPQEEVHLVPLPGARFADGSPLRAEDVAASLRALARAASPYLSLLAPVADLDAALQAEALSPEAGLRLPLAYAWPDLEASLCHPAFTPTRGRPGGGPAQGVGLYAPGAEGRLWAARGAPRGPPFPAALAFSPLRGRAAAQALQRGEVHALLGETTGPDGGPLLFATYLVYRPDALPAGARAALEAVDVQALVRTFVPGPAVALHALLPDALLPAGAAAPAPPRPPAAAAAPARPFTLGYEVGVADQRAVAERLQVLLHDRGFPVRLRADSRAALLQARSTGALEATLVSLLLPPLPAPALALVLGLAQDAALLQRELPALGQEGDASARAVRAAQRALALAAQVPVLPLYVRGLRAGVGEALVDARRDGFGLLVLDDAWLLR